jgi:RHS repeat-associated protein
MRSQRVVVSICPVVGFTLLLAACGGSDIAGTSPRAAGLRQGGNALTAPAYVAAPQTCAAMPGPAKIAPSPIASATTHLSGYRVCGPFTATTRLASFDCPRPSTASGPFRLLVYNGRPDGTGRVSEAEISLNGRRILHEDAFDEHVASAAARVELAASNQIAVVLHDLGDDDGNNHDGHHRPDGASDHPGDHDEELPPPAPPELRLEIVDEGQTCFAMQPATVTRASPLDRRFARMNAFPIPEFQLFPVVDGEEHENVKKGRVALNGVALIGKHELGEKTTAILKPVSLNASNRIIASVREGSFTTQIVDRDKTPPQFTIALPLDGSFTNKPQLPLSGSIDDPSATLTVNGALATLASGGYTGQATLTECWNTITVAAADVCTNAGSAQVRVGLDTVPPVLVVLGPPDGLVTNQGSSTVLIRYSDNFSGADPTTLRVALDGVDITSSLTLGSDSATGVLANSEGRHILTAQIADRAGNATQAQARFTIDFTPPTLAIVSPKDGSSSPLASQQIVVSYADALSGVDLSRLAILVDGRDLTSRFTVDGTQAVATLAFVVGQHQVAAQIADLAGNVSRARSTFTIKDALPPDPKTVAPPLDRTVATALVDATAFLYSGSNPIQTGVAAGTIDGQRVAVIRGKVRTMKTLAGSSAPIPGVQVAILDHPEFGSTLTRADGAFDLAVNGGGSLTLSYSKDGFLPVQRNVETSWRDYTIAQDVVLTPYDPSNPQVTPVTVISTGAAAIQVAVGPTVTDSDGPRAAKVLFPAGTQATALLADGTTRPLGKMTVSATEFTVGADGPNAMPGTLPATSQYTYAVELRVDEAMRLGAERVAFSQPVYFYLENFLKFPTGSNVPTGDYDPKKGLWVASKNGAVIKILSVANGQAALDVDGSGVAAPFTPTLAAMGFTAAELQMLASYPVGQSLWRVPLDHFSIYDMNYGVGIPPDAVDPNLTGAKPAPLEDKSCTTTGCIIETENQVLGDIVPLTGTAHALHYQSDRSRGFRNSLRIPVSPSTLPQSLQEIQLSVQVAGRDFHYSFRPVPNQVFTFGADWDGTDAYGRIVQGQQPAKVTLGYCYPIIFSPVAKFAAYSRGYGAGTTRGAANFCLAAKSSTQLGMWDETAAGLGGWSLTPHHEYDPVGRILYAGNGTHRSADALAKVITTVAGGEGNRQLPLNGDGTPATTANLARPYAIVQAPDGSLYIADTYHSLIRKVTPDGIIHTVAGTGEYGYGGDGGPALSAKISLVTDLALAKDGTLYLADANNYRIRKVDPAGIISTFAGLGYPGYSWGEGPATQQPLYHANSIALDDDGNLLIANVDLFRVTPDGIMSRAASTPYWSYSGFEYVAKGPAGSMYVTINNRITRLNRDGTYTPIGGTGSQVYSGDGGSALYAGMYLRQLAVSHDGTVVFSDWSNSGRIRMIRPDGVIYTLAGGGYSTADGIPATQALLGNYTVTQGVGIGVDGNIYLTVGDRVRRIGASLPTYSPKDFFVPSEDGKEVYFFDARGKHMRTLDALTGAVRLTFGYDASGLLSTMTDQFQNVTSILRDSSGRLTGATSPFGVSTRLSLDSDGHLAQVTNPAGEAETFTYSTTGLLLSRTNARGFTHQLTYDSFGRLTSDADPAGGSKSLSGSVTDTDRSVVLSIAVTPTQSRSTTYATHASPDGTLLRTITDATGLSATLLTGQDKSETSRTPDGMTSIKQLGPDPRFGMNSPTSYTTAKTPSGLTASTYEQRSATLANPGDALSLATQTDTISVNGLSYTTTFNRATNSVTTSTPAGRRSTTLLDAFGRVVQTQVPGVLPMQMQYDARGRLVVTTQGTRSYAFAYDARSNLASITDPLGRPVSFQHDAANRPILQTLPDGRSFATSYDASGNVTSVTPPGKPAHSFAYTPVDLEQSYSPPALGFPSATLTSYNLDKQVSLISRPAGDTVVPSYDSAGRLASLTTAWGTTSYSYSPTTGQLAQITAPDLGKLSYAYDGSLITDTSWSGSVSGSIHRSYDNFFRVASENVSGGQATSYQYDADGLLTAAGALQIARDATTGFATRSALGGTTESRTYDAYGTEASYTASFGGSNLYSVTYVRDALGRIASKTERVGPEAPHTLSYSYDLAGRLADVSKDRIPAHYAYDSNGNRLAGPGLNSTPAYDAQDRLLFYGACSYTYKASGELQTKTCADGTTTYDYDALGNLRHVGLPNGTQIDYLIDGQNRRIGKKVNGALIEGFVYRNELQPAAWLDGTGAVKATFIYGLHPNVPEYMVQGATTYRLITDQVGSVTLVVNAVTGAVAERIDWDEFGNVLADSAPSFQPFGFAGGLRDVDTALTRFGARDYDSVSGRWTAKDPLRFSGGLSNVYSYVGADPINRADSSGTWSPYGLVGGIICGLYDVYDAYDTWVINIRKHANEVAALNAEIVRLRNKCFSPEGSEEDLRRLEDLQKQVINKSMELAKEKVRGYAKDIAISAVCVAIAIWG